MDSFIDFTIRFDALFTKQNQTNGRGKNEKPVVYYYLELIDFLYGSYTRK